MICLPAKEGNMDQVCKLTHLRPGSDTAPLTARLQFLQRNSFGKYGFYSFSRRASTACSCSIFNFNRKLLSLHCQTAAVN